MATRTRRQKATSNNPSPSQNPSQPPEPDQEATNTSDTVPENAPASTIRILKKATCSKLSTRASGELTYHLGYREEDSQVLFRITANQSSGYFSQEWIALEAIDTKLAEQNGQPFKAIILKPLYERKGANNHGFLAAALKAEGLLIADEQQPLVLTVNDDRQPFDEQITEMLKEGIDLHDDVAEENARKEARKQERLAEQQRRRDARLAEEKARKEARSKPQAPQESEAGPSADSEGQDADTGSATDSTSDPDTDTPETPAESPEKTTQPDDEG